MQNINIIKTNIVSFILAQNIRQNINIIKTNIVSFILAQNIRRPV